MTLDHTPELLSCEPGWRVHNINGTSAPRYSSPPKGCTSHEDYYRQATGSKRETCSCCGKKDTLVGAHVQINDSNKWWYILLCKKCNGQSGDIKIRGKVTAVAVNP